jgi:ABC transporter substrate binding protein
VRRREFITLLGGAAAWPFAVRAQSPKMLRVGYSGMLPREAPHYAAFEKRMAELGYQEGRNFKFEYIQAPSIEGYELTYRELAARNVDILLAAGNEPALRAARAATGTTPIVFIALDFDPVEKGYVASLSRPGSNSTGVFVSQLELAALRSLALRSFRDAFDARHFVDVGQGAVLERWDKFPVKLAHEAGALARNTRLVPPHQRWEVIVGLHTMLLRTRTVFEVMSAARPLFHRKRKSIGGLAKSAPTSLLADQQNKSSGSYQHRKQNTDDELNNPMPAGLDFFRSSALLRRSDTQPEQKFVHGDQRRHRRCFVAALLCLR